MVYVTDTHALIWYLSGDERIGRSAKRIFSQLETGRGKLIISIIVFLETLVLIEKVKIKFTWEDFNDKATQFPTAVVYPVGLDLLCEIKKTGESLELHDRILVTTAKIHKAILITRDKQIRRVKGVRTLW